MLRLELKRNEQRPPKEEMSRGEVRTPTKKKKKKKKKKPAQRGAKLRGKKHWQRTRRTTGGKGSERGALGKSSHFNLEREEGEGQGKVWGLVRGGHRWQGMAAAATGN